MEIQPEKKSSTSFLDSLDFIEVGQGIPPKSPQKPPPEVDLQTPNADSHSEPHRVSSSQRMKYEAEVNVIQNRFGNLEEMRRKLGLSQRKMAQLLMVDPSAWTRWTRDDGQAPPHIYRSLSWFLLLQEKNPETNPYQWLTSVSRPALPEKELSALKDRLSMELRVSLETQLRGKFTQRLESSARHWKWLFVGQAFLFFILLALYARS
jgi:transcriptional regulator with XRE-family HTH domain